MIFGILLDHPPTTPDTTGYMILGFAVIFTVMAIHIFSLYQRNRNLRIDLSLLEEIEDEES
ncbi:MAG: hypothetical protein OEV06_08740 [Anaerolineae bacterium]|nr:hypothetical protein [Anaerolineae bacterium]